MASNTKSRRTGKAIPWSRIGVELIAISVAVYLGLLADNYRESRQESIREAEYLALFANDLDSDLAALDYTRSGIENLANAAQLIHRAAGGADVAVSEIEWAFAQLFMTWTYEQQRPTYLALRSGVGLHIITDHELRSALTNYYETDQTRLQQDYIENFNQAQQRLRNQLDTYVRFLPPEEFTDLTMVPADFDVARLRPTTPGLADDISFVNSIAEVGGRGFELVGEIDRIKQLNRSLRTRLVAVTD